MAHTPGFPLSRLVSISLLACLSWWAPDAAANAVDHGPFNTKYPTYYATNSCNSCHTASIPGLNSYGAAYKTAVLARGGRNATNAPLAMTDIEPADTDGDGYRNLIELTRNYRAHDATHFPTASVSLSTSPTSKTGSASTTVSYTVTVSNNGNIPDSFTLGVSVTSGESWSSSIVGTANNVAAAGSTSITVNVAIPGGAATGQSSTARVTATSQANTTIAATPLDLTTSIPSVAAVARYVNAATGNNTSSCTTAATPCRTITYAMAQATAGAPGDAINVAPGTYNAALGETFPIDIKSGVQLFATGGAESTIVDATGGSGRIFNATGSNSFTVLQGFTITGGLHNPATSSSNAEGGALKVAINSEIRIRRNIFTGNEARGAAGTPPSNPSGGIAYGGAIVSSGSSPVIENNVFSGNRAVGGNGLQKFDGSAGGSAGNAHGGAIWLGGAGAAVIANNTFYLNYVQGGTGGTTNGSSGGSGGIAFNGAVESSNARVDNNIFASNSAIAGAGGSPGGSAGNALNGALSANSSPSTTKNLFFGNSSDGTTGTGPVFADPQFHSVPSNLRIQALSPAGGAGTATGAPARDFDARVRPAPPAIGAFEPSALPGGSAPNLVLSQTNSPATGNAGKDLIFTLTVTNSGAAAASGVAVSNAIPAGATFIWAPSGCTHASGTVTCSVGSLPAGASVPIKIVVRPAAAGVSTNTASATASQSDAAAGNNSSTLGVTVNATPVAAQVQRYRLYSDVTKEHLFTTDLNEYNVLGSYVGTWVQEGPVGKVLNNPGSFGGVTAVPYYRLYESTTQWHHWTTDANEYYTLVQFPGWNGEGVDGYILPTAATGAVQLYRLNYPALGSLHHWTIDANEYNTLILPAYGWVGEGGAGFVIQ